MTTTQQKAKADRATAERWQHGAYSEINDEGVQIVSNGVALLRKRGKIDDADEAACERWRKDYEFAVHGVREAGTGNGNDPGGFMDARLKASEDYHAAREAISDKLNDWLIMFVAAGWSLQTIARKTGHTPHTAPTVLTTIIQLLTHHYSKRDGFQPNTNAPIRTIA